MLAIQHFPNLHYTSGAISPRPLGGGVIPTSCMLVCIGSREELFVRRFLHAFTSARVNFGAADAPLGRADSPTGSREELFAGGRGLPQMLGYQSRATYWLKMPTFQGMDSVLHTT